MVKLCILGSGSRGNATYVEFDCYGILIDAGFSFKELRRRLGLIGRSIEKVKTVFVSHDHKDHVQAIPQIQKKYGDVFIHNSEFPSAIITSKGYIQTKNFKLSHDSPCYGFDFKYETFKLTYISDTGCITEDAVKALFDIEGVNNHVVIIECNYDHKMLTEGSYNSELIERVFSENGHMDNVESARILKEIRHDKLRLVLPFHLSSENNNPGLVEYEIKRAVGPSTQVVCTEQQVSTQVFYYV
jgi:phosphoribosyl 1,2-cyclic phosphodiesterase